MASTIKIKNSSTAGAVPGTGDLVQGELAINVTDRRIFTENASGTVVELGTPSIDDNGNATAITIDSSENVGIGTSSPAVKLHTTGTTNELARFNASSTGTGYVLITQNNSTGEGLKLAYTNSDGSTAIGSVYSGALKFLTGDTERARIDSSGNICFGTTAPIIAGYQTNSYNGGSFRGLVLNDTTSTSGGTFAGFAIAGTQIGSITRVAATSAVAFNTTSDERLKENIADADAALEVVGAIKVRKYDWKEGGQHEDHGFIAQELAEVVNNVVSQGRTEEDMWAVDYGKLTPLLVKAIQEQQAMITSQSELITTLTERITALEGAQA